MVTHCLRDIWLPSPAVTCLWLHLNCLFALRISLFKLAIKNCSELSKFFRISSEFGRSILSSCLFHISKGLYIRLRFFDALLFLALGQVLLIDLHNFGITWLAHGLPTRVWRVNDEFLIVLAVVALNLVVFSLRTRVQRASSKLLVFLILQLQSHDACVACNRKPFFGKNRWLGHGSILHEFLKLLSRFACGVFVRHGPGLLNLLHLSVDDVGHFEHMGVWVVYCVHLGWNLTLSRLVICH